MDESNKFIDYLGKKQKKNNKNYRRYQKQERVLNYNLKSKLIYESKKILNKMHYSKRKGDIHLFNEQNIKLSKKIKKEKLFSFSYINKSCIIFILILLLILIFFENDSDIIIPNNLNIKVAFYFDSIRYGGIQRVMASLINILSVEKHFTIYLITRKGKSNDEYPLPNSTTRIILPEKRISLYQALEIEHIDILIYNFFLKFEIERLNKITTTKIIFYNHSSFFMWIYQNMFNIERTIYQSYKNSKYLLTLIPLENDYLFKKWGINSILIDNPPTFDYNLVTPSDLSQKNIVLIGRSIDPYKRYYFGIKAMVNIIKEVPDCKMQILGSANDNLLKLIKELNLENYVNFTGFMNNIEPYLKNASLHILSSFSESYSLALSETKIFGIPSIICGLDYLTLAKGGTVIIYDDNPDTIAKEAIKILKDDKYRKKLGKGARESMKRHKNNLIMKKWKKILLAVYKGDDKSFKKLADNTLTEKEAKKILNNQFQLFIKRRPQFNRLSLEKFESFSFL